MLRSILLGFYAAQQHVASQLTVRRLLHLRAQQEQNPAPTPPFDDVIILVMLTASTTPPTAWRIHDPFCGADVPAVPDVQRGGTPLCIGQFCAARRTSEICKILALTKPAATSTQSWS